MLLVEWEYIPQQECPSLVMEMDLRPIGEIRTGSNPVSCKFFCSFYYKTT